MKFNRHQASQFVGQVGKSCADEIIYIIRQPVIICMLAFFIILLAYYDVSRVYDVPKLPTFEMSLEEKVLVLITYCFGHPAVMFISQRFPKERREAKRGFALTLIACAVTILVVAEPKGLLMFWTVIYSFFQFTLIWRMFKY